MRFARLLVLIMLPLAIACSAEPPRGADAPDAPNATADAVDAAAADAAATGTVAGAVRSTDDAVWAYGGGGEGANPFALATGDIDPADASHELVVGQPLWDGGGGRVLYFADLSDTIPDAVLRNPRQRDTYFGASLSVGDVNGDGAADILVGERTRRWRDTADVGGQATLFLGDPAGGPPGQAPALVLADPHPGASGADAALDNFADHVHIANEGIPAGAGIARLFVGARNHSQGRGAVYAYSAAGTLLWTRRGGPGEFLGKWVETADLDGVGEPDLVIGGARPANEDPHPTGGVVRLLALGMGGSLARPTLEFDLPHPEEALSTGLGQANFGYRAVAGDATGDGVVDLIAADPYADRGTGAAYLYEGPIRPGHVPAWIFRGNPELVGSEPLLGRGIDFGDFDGDGIGDFVVGASAWANRTDKARVYLFLGGPVSELPGSGIAPRIAVAPAADFAFRPAGWGTLGEHAILAPLLGDPEGREQMVSAIFNSGRPAERGVFVFR